MQTKQATVFQFKILGSKIIKNAIVQMHEIGFIPMDGYLYFNYRRLKTVTLCFKNGIVSLFSATLM